MTDGPARLHLPSDLPPSLATAGWLAVGTPVPAAAALLAELARGERGALPPGPRRPRRPAPGALRPTSPSPASPNRQPADRPHRSAPAGGRGLAGDRGRWPPRPAGRGGGGG